jgi:hypothetical protein
MSNTPKRDALPLRQRATLDGLLRGLSQTDAYAAGYGDQGKRRSVHTNAARLVASDRFTAALNESEAARREANEATEGWIVAKLVESVGEASRHSDRIRALDLLGRRLGLWSDRDDRAADDVPDTAAVRSLTVPQLAAALALLRGDASGGAVVDVAAVVSDGSERSAAG